jgi:hypothetical protein
LSPGSPTSEQRGDILSAEFDGRERRTGALVFGPSGTVEDDQFVGGELCVALADLIGGQGEGPIDVGGSVGCLRADIDEDGLPSVGH